MLLVPARSGSCGAVLCTTCERVLLTFFFLFLFLFRKPGLCCVYHVSIRAMQNISYGGMNQFAHLSFTFACVGHQIGLVLWEEVEG